MKKTFQQGFTLIELLVVVAIIGILATVVTASLGSARNKAKDAKVQSELSGVRASAELTALSAGDYDTVCASTTTITGSSVTVSNCYDSATAWAANKALPSASGSFFCVDSSGASATTSGTTIGASDFAC